MIISTLLSPPSPLVHHRNNHHHHHHNHRTLASRQTQQPTTQNSAIIIGGGLSGLAAALKLHSSSIPFTLLEASDGVGGRVRTDTHPSGYLLDRGFQIFITAYPEAQKVLHYPTLNLKKFFSGAKVYFNGNFHTVSDPTRHFFASLGSLTNPIGTPLDKLLVGVDRFRLPFKPDEEIFASDEVSILEKLKKGGFSDDIVDRFYRPFFGGVFFDRELETSSRLYEFIFKCLALGDNTLPEKGIGEIPRQLASRLPRETVRLNSRVVEVEEVEGGGRVSVRLESGEEMVSEVGVILAVEEPEVVRLLAGKSVNGQKTVRETKPSRSTICLYFSTDRDKIPSSEPVLYLNGTGKGIVNNMFFATNVVPTYGPPGKGLVSVSLIGLFDDVGDDELVNRVVRELSEWFGEGVVRSWEHLRTYRIAYAQPDQSPPTDLMKRPRIGSGLVYLCGDYQTSATFDGALVSGRVAAEALIEDRGLVSVSNA